MDLTSQNVGDTFRLCLFIDGEDTDDAVMVDGIMGKIGLNPDKLEENKSNIENMLSELPKEFHKDIGGGWSFLSACNNSKGEQWTGLHAIMDQLFILGMAIKKVKYLMPRGMWSVMPGGMPYLVVIK